MSERPICTRTGKRCFSSVHDARKAMRATMSARLRAYRCDHCRMWHLTKLT